LHQQGTSFPFQEDVRMSTWLLLGAALGLVPAAPGSDELAPPVRLTVGGKAINVTIGHAAPFYGDIDGSGTPSLLVGQFADGKLRIYRNTGTAKEPKFDAHTWFLDGKPEGTVPAS
jgi:hypothetical protein